MNVFGIPMWVVGVVCFGVAGAYFIYWPRPRRGGGVTFVILRWFHSLVWILLGAACFIAPVPALGGVTSGTVAALLALLCYVVFMIALFRDRLAALPRVKNEK